MKSILLFGTFDFLHSGHISFFRQAKKQADRIVVAVARDSIVKELKGRIPFHSEKERIDLVKENRLVDQVILGDSVLGIYRVIKKIKPNIIGLGYDQHALRVDLKQYIKKNNLLISIIQFSAYKGHKSSEIKKLLGL